MGAFSHRVMACFALSSLCEVMPSLPTPQSSRNRTPSKTVVKTCRKRMVCNTSTDHNEIPLDSKRAIWGLGRPVFRIFRLNPETDTPPKTFRFHTKSHSKSEDFPFCDQMPLGFVLSATVRGNAFAAKQNRLSATARVFRTFAEVLGAKCLFKLHCSQHRRSGPL